MRSEAHRLNGATPTPVDFITRLDALRDELLDMAFLLERRGRLDAADITLALSSRLSAWREEWAAAELRPTKIAPPFYPEISPGAGGVTRDGSLEP